MLKFIWKRDPEEPKQSNENKVGELALHNFRTNCNATGMKTV